MKTGIIDDTSLFDQLTTMSKAYGYDVLAKDNEALKEENKQLREEVKRLQDLIKEYAGKLKDNVTTMQNILK